MPPGISTASWCRASTHNDSLTPRTWLPDSAAMFEDLKGRVALVTGGATGIGGAISATYGAAGMRVAVHYHAGSEAARAVAQQIRSIGGEVLLLQSDIIEAK